MESNAISLSQKQIICDLESPTLGRATRRCAASEALPCFTPWKNAVNGVMLISLLVQTHWRKVESACFVAETDLQWCSLVSVSSESHHPTATAASTCERERVERIKTQALVSHGYPVHRGFSAFRHTICCTFNTLFWEPVNVVKEEYVVKQPGWIIGVWEKGKLLAENEKSSSEGVWENVSDPSLCDSTPWWKQYIHLRTGRFMVHHCLASVLLSMHFRDSSPQARSFIPPPVENLKLSLHVTILYCAIVAYLMEYCRILQYHSGAAGTVVPH